MLQFLVGGRGRNEEAVSVSSGQTTDDPGPANSGVNDGDDVGELGLEDRVEVGRGG
jgi:hypothetical protein